MTSRHARIAIHILALGIVALAALLRLDAYVGKYGTLDRPAWARTVTTDVAALGAAIRPSGVTWHRDPSPYAGSDPINYLAYAREMQSFYQPHVREPGYLALTRAALWSLDGQDAAASLASATGSTLAVLATYLLGAALLSPLAGLFAALLLAIEYEAIMWAPDGWRDDTFTAMVVFAAWALVRLHQRPTFAHALIAGAFCGAACLTRITAITFIVPALVWIALASRGDRVRRLQHSGTAALIASLIVAPYLISCAIATGDPLYAVNYHTVYYRHAEGMDISKPVSASDYVRAKFLARPAATFDTGFVGLFVQPFNSKWNGLAQWSQSLQVFARWAAAAGLALLTLRGDGRLLLVILLTSLLPYAFTWNVAGGGAFRFTMHAYPIYLVAAAGAVHGVISLLAAVRAPRQELRRANLGWRAGAIATIAATGAGLYFGLPWQVVTEAIAAGESTSIETGARDAVFFRGGWSLPRPDGVMVRVSTDQKARVRIPLPSVRTYDLVLRLDPVADGGAARLDVLFNRRLVGRLNLTATPGQMGSYRLRVPADATRAGSNELVLLPEGGAIRLWYVRVLP